MKKYLIEKQQEAASLKESSISAIHEGVKDAGFLLMALRFPFRLKSKNRAWMDLSDSSRLFIINPNM